MANIAFIIGNGFNHFIYSLIDKYSEDLIFEKTSRVKADILHEITEITQLWKRFDEIFSELILKSENRLNEEQLIQIVHTLFEVLPQLENFKKLISPNLFRALTDIFDSVLLSKIQEVTDRFRQHQESGGYGNIRSLFPEFGRHFETTFSTNHVCQIFTTNYDGILDALLSKPQKKYIYSDCFINTDPPSNYLQIIPDFVNEPNRKLLAHIHGSYLYEKVNGITYKQRPAGRNQNPSVVFNNPNYKLSQISADNVLSTYFDRFVKVMKTFNVIILVGNSLETEPHIKVVIKKYFDRSNTKIIVCDTSPDQIASKLKLIYNGEIRCVDMKQIYSLNQLFGTLSSQI